MQDALSCHTQRLKSKQISYEPERAVFGALSSTPADKARESCAEAQDEETDAPPEDSAEYGSQENAHSLSTQGVRQEGHNHMSTSPRAQGRRHSPMSSKYLITDPDEMMRSWEWRKSSVRG